jgi:hypothetical protein
MKQLFSIILFFFTYNMIFSQVPIKKKVFKYSYDDAGNRTMRQYINADPCPAHPDCSSRKRNDTLVDSLFNIAQNIEITLPKTPTEKIELRWNG